MQPVDPSAHPAVGAVRASKVRTFANAAIAPDNSAGGFGHAHKVAPGYRRAIAAALGAQQTRRTPTPGPIEPRPALARYLGQLRAPVEVRQNKLSSFSPCRPLVSVAGPAASSAIAFTPLGERFACCRFANAEQPLADGARRWALHRGTNRHC